MTCVADPLLDRFSLFAVRRCLRAYKEPAGFTLVEMLAVMAIMSVLLALILPVVTSLNTGRSLTAGAYDISGLLEEARAYAKANNTYTWVGFYEEDANQPNTAGVGRIILSAVASKDATAMYPVNGDASPLTPANLIQIDKLVKIDNAHLAELSATDVPTRTVVPAASYQVGDSSFGNHVSVSSPTSGSTPNKVTFNYPIPAQAGGSTYTFVKIIQFSPVGDAVKIVDTPQPLMEVGLRPTHGDVTDTLTTNCLAIQVEGITGQVRLYRP